MGMIYVAAGGACGAVCRYLLGNFIGSRLGGAWPWGTWTINILGSFCMGLLMVLIVEKQLLPAEARLFLCVGLLGGFTTFSSFSYELLQLFLKGGYVEALLYGGTSVVLGLGAAALGAFLGQGAIK